MAVIVSPRLSVLLDAVGALSAGPGIVGGKAFGLARLYDHDVRVPPWFVLPATVFREHLVSAGVAGEVRALIGGLEGDRSRSEIAHVSAQLRELVATVDVDGELRSAIDAMRSHLGAGPLAVRSSAADEDSASHSFAGQLDTVLDVNDETLEAAIRRCWRSAFNERVLDYRLRTASLSATEDVAVIVQTMIRGEVSGVLFTADPITGRRDRMRLSACTGTGDALVSGDVDADECLLDRTGEVVEYRARGPASLLNDATLAELARLGGAIESAEGEPRDIEWTIAGGEIWVLQSRPITTLTRPLATVNEQRTPDNANRESTLPISEPAIVWDNSNIQESYCGVTTPLTFSFAQRAYASVYEQTMRTVGIRESIVREHRPMLHNLLGLIHGRVYYNINNWYRGLLLLPAFQRNKEDMERMMGVDEPVDFVADESLHVIARMRRIPSLLATAARLAVRFATLGRDSARFLAHVDSTITSIDRASLAGRPLGELMRVLDTLQRECLDRWTTPIVNDFYVMMTVGRLRRLVERSARADVDRVMQTLLGGADVAISAAPAMLMLEMADAARAEPFIVDALCDGVPQVALRSACAASPRFQRAYSDLIDRFGDRCMGELKLESHPLRDDHAFVVGVLRNYLAGATSDPHVLTERARRDRERVEREVLAGMTAMRRWRFVRALQSARRAIRARETMRLARTRLFGTYRDTYRAIGAHLCAEGRLDAIDDIFYVTVGEIDACWNRTAVTTELRSLVVARRREFAAFEAIEAPNRVVIGGSPTVVDAVTHSPPVPTPPNPAASLRGIGASPGIAAARVRIVTGPTDDLSLAGHVLVATRTDPGWAPLFPSAVAIVVERGSVLSHSAVLARELGIPAVVSVPNVVRTLRNGELVRVDGTTGVIERLEDRCES